jgi:hypothetical protein
MEMFTNFLFKDEEMRNTCLGTILTTNHMRTYYERPKNKSRDNIKIAVTEMRCDAVDEAKLNS